MVSGIRIKTVRRESGLLRKLLEDVDVGTRWTIVKLQPYRNRPWLRFDLVGEVAECVGDLSSTAVLSLRTDCRPQVHRLFPYPGELSKHVLEVGHANSPPVAT